MPKKKEDEDSELEDITEEEEIEEVVEKINHNSLPKFDSSELMFFLPQEEFVSPVLEQVVNLQNEVRLENVASEARTQDKDENPREKSYTIINGYETSNKYSETSSDDTSSTTFGVRDSVGKNLGLQEFKKEDSRDEYFAPKKWETKGSDDAQKYHSRKFK